jgi:hypothetical protein
MVGSRFRHPEIIAFHGLLLRAGNWQEAKSAERVLSTATYGIDAIISLPFPDTSSSIKPFVLPPDLPREYIGEYLFYSYKYFIKHAPVILPQYVIDYSVMFDSNMAGYINVFVKGGSLGAQDAIVRPVIENIINAKINFDDSFYFVENIKQVRPLAVRVKAAGGGPQDLWAALDEGFRENIVNLTLFKGIDHEYFWKTRDLRFDISKDEAIRMAIDVLGEFYLSDEFSELIDYLLSFQMIILLQLLAALRIQYSSNEGPKKKLTKLLEYLQKNGVYFEREAVIAYRYFKDRDAVPIMNAVNKGGKHTDILSKIDNLAWDMTLPRWMEMFTAANAPGDFMVPVCLTFDHKLLELIRCFSVKAVIIDRNTGSVLPVPVSNTMAFFQDEGCGEVFANFKSVENWEKRHAIKQPTIDELARQIDIECDALKAVLDS